MRLEFASAMALALVAGATGCPPTPTPSCTTNCGTSTSDGGSCNSADKTRKIGSACSTDADCPNAACDTSAACGYCTQICSGQANTTSSACPTEATCVGVNEATSICLASCSATKPCRRGYVCLDANGSNVCLPACTADSDCAEGTGCNTGTGLCDAAHVPLGKVGAACTANAQCASNGCTTEAGSNGMFPGGYCVKGCTADLAVNADFCPNNDGLCLDLGPSNGKEVYACLEACTTSVDCRKEYTCTASADMRNAAGFGVCLPRCDHYDCSPGYQCDASLGLCMEAGTGTADGGVSDVRHVALGQVQAGTTLDTTGQFSVKLNSDDTALSLVIAPATLTNTPIVTKVTAPSGQVLFDLSSPTGSTVRIVNIGAGVQGLLLPNSPRVTPEVGTYEFSVGSTPTTTGVTIDAFIRRGNPTGGSLPVNFWFFRGNGPTAATAQTDSKLAAALDGWKQVYQGLGITLSPVTYNDVPAPESTSCATITDPEGQEPALMNVAAAKGKLGLNIFFVDQITASGLPPGMVLLGASRGIPGAHSSPGLGHSGIVLNYLAIDTGTQLGHVLAHEAGHYLGLFHTTEQPGTTFDPLLDTPECPKTQDANNDGVVKANECQGHGVDNMMFWQDASGQVTQNVVSAEQRFVLLHNTMVQ